MEKKKTVFDYLGQILIVFGFSMLIMNLLCLAFGNEAKDISAMFVLGNRGVPVEIAFQFLCVSALTVGARFVFFTDTLIKNMPIWMRTVCMLIVIILIIAAFVAVFRWFPVGMWQPWAMFFACFGLSFFGSYFVMVIKEKAENKRMEEALRRFKEKEGKAE